MKKKFRVLLISAVILGLTLSLVGMALVSQAAPPERPAKPDKEKPVPATDVELVKKVTLRPSPPITPPGQDKKNAGPAATGVLGDPVAGNRYAIVIGISDYPGTGSDLSYSDDDAEEMYLALTSLYGFSGANIVKLIDKEGTETSGGTLVATRKNILSAIESIGKVATLDDEVVFFFSGHGTKGVASDGDRERIDEAIAVVSDDSGSIVPIWDGELKTAFSGFATSRIIFAFDSCLAGGMKKDLEAAGRVIAMAATETGYAYESDTWQNGEFSYYFVDQGMLDGKANTHDYDKDGITLEPKQVTVEEAWDYTKANCDYDTPTIGDYFENDLLL